jgi:hypothetical protein
MTEKTIKTFSDVVATAKTQRKRGAEIKKLYLQITDLEREGFPASSIWNELNKKLDEKLVSLGLVLRLREYWVGELHKLEKAKELANKENVVVPYMDGCISLLREVFGVGLGEKKEGDNKNRR